MDDIIIPFKSLHNHLVDPVRLPMVDQIQMQVPSSSPEDESKDKAYTLVLDLVLYG